MSSTEASSLSPHDRCEKFVRDVLANVNTISYLVDSIKKLGREITEADFKCVPNRAVLTSSGSSSSGSAQQPQQPQQQQQAGYMWVDTKFAKRGSIVLLEEMLRERDDVERAVRHELVHAFDDARGEIEPTNCYHQACSEIRAARLSGDCFIGEEIKRGRVGTVSGRDCCQRRAILAVENNPLCRGFGARSVEVVMPRCYRDFEPFVSTPYAMGSNEGKPF